VKPTAPAIFVSNRRIAGWLNSGCMVLPPDSSRTYSSPFRRREGSGTPRDRAGTATTTRNLRQGCAGPEVCENIADTPKGGPSENWTLLLRSVRDLVSAVAESSHARNAADTRWQAQSFRARAPNGGR
jgi:hypothetical protein